MGIFGFFGSILGYLLWALFYVFQNFGIAIILFTVIVKVFLFPFSVKQQKSMANTSRMQKKQREIQKKYGDNKVKMNEEMQKLYEKEGVSPTGGCLTSIVPLFIMLGIFYSVAYPLTNTLHINSDTVTNALNYVQTMPGFSVVAGLANDGTRSVYQEINLVRILSEIPELISQLFPQADVEKINMFVNGFNFAGFNLLTTPNTEGIFSVYFLVPVLCFVSSVGSQVITMKLNGNMQNQQGCMKFMIYGLPLFSAWIAYTVPSAVGFYWICSSLFALVQSIIMHKFFGPAKMIAKSEAQHIALLEENEKNVKYTYAPTSNRK